MTSDVATISDPDAEIRWRDWKARGAASDRRTATRMRGLMIFIITALAAWFVVQLA